MYNSCLAAVQERKTATAIRFGPFEMDLSQRVLRKHGVKVRLQSQPFEVLAAMLERPGMLVTRDELRHRLWPEGTFVDFEHGLNAAVAKLRQTLGDSSEQPRYVERVAKQGYRFVAQIISDPAVAEEQRGSPPVPEVKHISARRSPAGAIAVVFCALGAICALVLWSLWPGSAPQAMKSRPLTAFRGMELNPALSPGGTHVAFAWNGEKQDNFDIYVIALPSGSPVRVTSHSAEDVSPAWSPDGRSIAFLRRLNATHAELLVTPAEGGPEHKIAETFEQPWFAPRRPAAIAWSPDGRWIATPHRDPGDKWEAIYAFSLTGEKRRLTTPPAGLHSDRMPAFSPDGRTLAFSRLPGGFVAEIYTLALDGNMQPASPERRLTDHKRWSGHPVWSSDGRHILHAFGDHASDVREVRVIDVAHPHRAAETVPIRDGVAEISLGRHLVYSQHTEDTNIWRAELPGGGGPPMEGEPFIASTRVDQTPKYSPDGSKIAFASSRSGSREIWVAKADGSQAVRMTSFDGPIVGHPAWSHDGQWITFHARPEATTDIFTVPAAGGPTLRLTANEWEDHYPSYSRDGRWMFFSSRRSGEMQIWRMSISGTDAVQITRSGGAHMPNESPDGTRVFYHLSQDPGSIWSIPVQGGNPVEIVRPTQRFPVGFTVTSEGIYYGAPPFDRERRFIRFLTFKTGKDRPVVIANRPFHSGMSVSPDSRYILYDQYDESGSDLAMIEDFSQKAIGP